MTFFLNRTVTLDPPPSPVYAVYAYDNVDNCGPPLYICVMNRVLQRSVACWQASLVKTHQAELKRMREAHSESTQKNKDWQQVSGQSYGHYSSQSVTLQ